MSREAVNFVDKRGGSCYNIAVAGAANGGNMDIIAQIAGIVGAGLSIVSYQSKNNKGMFLMKGISGLMFAVNFILLGNITAGLLNLVNLFRGAVLAAGKKWTIWPIYGVIQLAYILCCVFTFGKGEMIVGGYTLACVFSVVMTCIQLLETTALWTRDGKKIRLAQSCVISPAWLINNVLTGSVGGIITEVFGIISVIISFVRYGINGFADDKTEEGKEA